MEECCLLENKYQVYKASHFEIQKMLKQQNKSDGEESDTQKINIREVFNRKVEEKSVGVPSPKKHEKYIAFKNNNKLLLQAEVGDDELMIMGSEVLNVDPITKQMMTDPIRIKQCGHTFERSSIMSLLKNRRHIKCPLPGCVQKHVTVNDLEENRELKLQLGRALQAKGANPI
ncbi:E3 SUMO-protein ligase NSE2-like isoform X2 [Zootermopsis nevadensis]|nr:E3 SUMO-protein ligase NSE2-like isoform X2 [Zootermopsis nevadensis]